MYELDVALDVMEADARGDAFVIVEFSQRAWDAYRNDLLNIEVRGYSIPLQQITA